MLLRCCGSGMARPGRFIPARRDHKAQLALMALPHLCPAHKALPAWIPPCLAPKARLVPMALPARLVLTLLCRVHKALLVLTRLCQVHKALPALPLSLLMLATPAPSAQIA